MEFEEKPREEPSPSEWKEALPELFDREQGLPEEVLGIRAEDVVSLAGSAEAISRAFWLRWPVSEERVQAAICLYPLLQKAAQGEGLTVKDVRPFRGAIKKIHEAAGCVDVYIGCLSWFPPAWILTIPARIALHRKIERGFIEATPSILERISDSITKVWPYVEYVTQFENPRQQLGGGSKFYN